MIVLLAFMAVSGMAQEPFYTCANCHIADAWRTDSLTLLLERNHSRLILLDQHNAPVDTLDGLPLQWLFVQPGGRWYGMGSWFAARGRLRARAIEVEDVLVVPVETLFDGTGVNFIFWKNWLICSGWAGKSVKEYHLWDVHKLHWAGVHEVPEASLFPASIRARARALSQDDVANHRSLVQIEIDKRSRGELYQFGTSASDLFIFDWLTATLIEVGEDGDVQNSWRIPSSDGKRKWQYCFDGPSGIHWVYYPFKKEILLFSMDIGMKRLELAARLPKGNLLRIVNGRAIYLNCQSGECRLEEYPVQPEQERDVQQVIELDEVIVKPQ